MTRARDEIDPAPRPTAATGLVAFAPTLDPMSYLAWPTAETALGSLMTALARGERLVLLEADRGLGKSTLLAELARRLRSPRRRVVSTTTLPDEEATLTAILRGLGLFGVGSPWWLLARAARLAQAQRVAVALLIDDADDPHARRLVARLASLATLTPGLWSVVAACRPRDDGTVIDEDCLVVPIEALTRDEAAFFMSERLIHEGIEPARFAPSALTRLHARANGVPRRLLALARAAQDEADASGRDRIEAGDIDGLDRRSSLNVEWSGRVDLR